ncbi:hypothetical protein D1007_19299 [Hordeum vulgare]|nr:hypothetical protein D1007_19299 [Hordeum vulgare]
MRLDVELADVDPQELESMKEKAVGNLVERIGESIVWGPEQEVSLQRFDKYYGEYVRIEDEESMVAEIDQQEGWVGKEVTFYAELIDLQTHYTVGYVPLKMDAQLEDDEWRGVVVVDWNVVELNEKTDLVITPISDIDMAEMFGIQVDDKDKEKDESSLPADGNTCPRNANEDEEELMRKVADDVDDRDDNELVYLYDKENPVSEVGKLWPSMVEFRTSFRTFAVRKEFDAKIMWTHRKNFYARCKGYDGGGNACKWYISARLHPDGSTIRVNQIPHQHTWQSETVTAEHDLTVSVTTESVWHALGQSEIVADEATIELPCDSALTVVLPCLEVVLPSVELQTEEVEQCVPSTQSAEVQTEELGHGQVQKLRRPCGVVGKNTKSISMNKLCAVEPNSGKRRRNGVVERSKTNRVEIIQM